MPNSPAFFPDDFPGEITLDHVIPGAAAEFAPLPQDMRPELAAALAARGIVSLYTHQADAYRAVRNGRHLVVVTPTASGKTLCYNLPVLQRLLEMCVSTPMTATQRPDAARRSAKPAMS
jgi:ATP-dependent helicase YprA (DUF1998 family)